MKLIQVSKGRVAKVDDDVFDRLSKFKWTFHSLGYAKRGVLPNKTVLMHHEILPLAPGFVTDHINGDKLDNRRSNLRRCTQCQNRANSRMVCRNSSGLKGIYLHSDGKKWCASVCFMGNRTYIGSFNTKEQAKSAYDRMAKQIFGEFFHP